MKKMYILIVMMLLFPLINVSALSCYNRVIDLKSNINNFECIDVLSTNITFKNSENGEDLTNKFQLEIKTNDRIGITILDRSISFDSTKKTGEIIISDGHNETKLIIKNNAYVEPVTTSQVITTKEANSKTVTLSLDPNTGDEIIKKTCEITNDNTYCSVVLPKLDNAQFNGWGTQKTCKEGKIGSERVYSDITYYACYKNNNVTTVKTTTVKNKVTTANSVTTTNSDVGASKQLYLKSLSLSDKKTSNNIDFGTFSIKKFEYELKVLNEVENIDVNFEADDGINVEVYGHENLIVGDNRIVITLKDDELNLKEYVLNVTRLKEGEKINKVSYLKSLDVGGFNINFNKEKFVYNLTIPNDINSLEINAMPENEGDTVSVKGQQNLVDGSVITITVNEESESAISYMINITKEKKVNILLIVAIVLISVLLVVLVVLIIVKSNKNKNNSSKKNSSDSVEVLNI